MAESSFQRAQRIFDSVCALDSGERESAIDRACVGDAALASMVKDLFRADERSLFLDRAAIDAEGALDAPMPERIGRYEIISILGEGGMGVVYRARQESPARDVALKVIRPGLASRSALARFAHEGEILGRLHHPGIAQILEAGSAGEGSGRQPFYAMELIHGIPVTAYVAEHDLSVRERLELMIAICEAVEHAHERGVIHRDLKPANILVSDTGQAKILDFGIARLTDVDVLTTTMHTGRGQLLGTLPYMSPEQVVGVQDDIDGRSDVYALGVIAYEVLCGELPLDLRDKPIAEAAGIICSEEPSKLGTLDRAMRGDIETIVATAMDKDPQRRYQSAGDFRADIERYLRDAPIVARPPSLVYQTRKFARRNKAAVGAVGVVFLVLVIATIISTKLALDTSRSLAAEKLALVAEKQALSAQNQALVAEKQAKERAVLALAAEKQALAAEKQAKEKAELEAAKSYAVTSFLERMLLSASPWGRAELSGPEVTLAQFLDVAVEGLGEFEDEPEVEASLLLTIGATYKELGRYREAEPLLERAVEIRERVLGAHHPMIAEALRHLGTTRVRLGRTREGIAMLQRSLAMMEAEMGAGHLDVARVHSDLGWAQYMAGQTEAAREQLSLALEAFRAQAEPDRLGMGSALANLGAVEKKDGRFDEAVSYYEAAIKVMEPGSLSAAVVISNLGNISYAGENYEESVRLHREALKILEANLDPYHPTIGTVLNNLGLALSRLGQLDEGVSLQLRALEISGRVYGKDSRDYNITLGNMAWDLHMLERYQEASDALLTVAKWYAENDPTSPKGPIRAVRAHAMTAGRMVAWEEGEANMLRAFEHLTDLADAENMYVIGGRKVIATFYDRWGKPERAAEFRDDPSP